MESALYYPLKFWKRYELIERFNKEHSEIGRLVWALEMVDKAISGDYCFKIYFKNGFTYRDDAVIRFVNFVSDGRFRYRM
jgi:hypothetical protein